MCGVVDSEGNTSITDGNFDKAGTQTPLAMYYDESSGERCIYFFENEHSLRKIYLDKDSIATVIPMVLLVGVVLRVGLAGVWEGTIQ